MKIGIIGGAGPLASALLYRLIIEESYRKGKEVPEIHICNFPFSRGLELQEGRANAGLLKEQLAYCEKILRDRKVDVLLLACNTLHAFIEDFKDFLPLPKLVLNKAMQNGAKKLLLLATETCIRTSVYRHDNMEILHPSPDLQNAIYLAVNQVLKGKIQRNEANLLSSLLENYRNKCDGIILGCTDLPVLHHAFPLCSPVPLYDSIQIPACVIGGLL